MIQRIVLAVALSAAPLCAGHATRAYDNWLVQDSFGGMCFLSETTMNRLDPPVRFWVTAGKGILMGAHVDVYTREAGTLTFSVDGHTFNALHPEVDERNHPPSGDAELPGPQSASR